MTNLKHIVVTQSSCDKNLSYKHYKTQMGHLSNSELNLSFVRNLNTLKFHIDHI